MSEHSRMISAILEIGLYAAFSETKLKNSPVDCHFLLPIEPLSSWLRPVTTAISKIILWAVPIITSHVVLEFDGSARFGSCTFRYIG